MDLVNNNNSIPPSSILKYKLLVLYNVYMVLYLFLKGMYFVINDANSHDILVTLYWKIQILYFTVNYIDDHISIFRLIIIVFVLLVHS